jgi:hypothetical protein
VSRTLVGELLNATGYSLQGNRKTKEGDSHPDRDAQFAHINAQRVVLSFEASHRSRVPHDCRWCNLVERLVVC